MPFYMRNIRKGCCHCRVILQHKAYLLLVKGLQRPYIFLLSCFIRPDQPHPHHRTDGSGEMGLPHQIPFQSGGAYLQKILLVDGIRLIQQIAEGPAHSLTVVNGDTLILVDEHPQVPACAFLFKAHVPEHQTQGFCQRRCKRIDLLLRGSVSAVQPAL